jgi:hypothetical protein
MTAYRLYLKMVGSIVARQDLEGENDADARQIAVALFNACSDTCQTVELWQGTRQIPLRHPHRTVSFSALSAGHQEMVVRTEETLVRSEWAIARSRQLIERLEQARQHRKLAP